MGSDGTWLCMAGCHDEREARWAVMTHDGVLLDERSCGYE